MRGLLPRQGYGREGKGGMCSGWTVYAKREGERE